MTKIRVTPSLLLEAANELQRISSEVEAVGDQVQTAASRSPSYEGQFGPEVKPLGLDAMTRSQKLTQNLSALAEELQTKGEEFEAADQKVLTTFERLAFRIRLAMDHRRLSPESYLGESNFPWKSIINHLKLGTLISGYLTSISLWIVEHIIIPLEQTTVPFVERVSMTELSVFFSQYEDSPLISSEILEKYLTNPTMMATQREVIADLVERISDPNNPPLTPQEFYQLVQDKVDDPGTALIICHNVLKEMARGRSPIGWSNVSLDPLVYSLEGYGEFHIDINNIHPQAVPVNHWEDPSAFYIIFSSQALGNKDPGDWYHYYLEAAAAYYGATERVDIGDYAAYLSLEDKGEIASILLDPEEINLTPEERGEIKQIGYIRTVGFLSNNLTDGLFDPGFPDTPAYKGWRWANGLSFLEGGYYGKDYSPNDQLAFAETLRESEIHMKGAIFGLELAGEKPAAGWAWRVPEPGVLIENEEITAIIGVSDLNGKTQISLYPGGEILSPTPDPVPTPVPTSTPVATEAFTTDPAQEPSVTPTPHQSEEQ